MIEPPFPPHDPNLNTDPLKDVYHDSFVDNPAHYKHLISHDTALLCIDLQYLDAAEGFGIFSDPDSSGVPVQGRASYFERLHSTVFPNVKAIQNAFRDVSLEVIHTRIQSLTQDGRDRGVGHKRLGLLASPGSKEAEFIETVAPLDDEIIINKTASGVYTSTNFHYVLKNLGINALFIVGVYTNECVETTARDACDLGYFVTVIEDACATVTPRLHEASLATLKDRYSRVISTAEALSDIRQYAVSRTEESKQG